jgi:tRNA A37 threonylcarbamoyladenosine modification protein TsaB
VTVVFSSSSPIASVALFDVSNELIAAADQQANNQAGRALLEMLDELLASCSRRLEEAELFASDLGPGSFTGVKVCVTLAKSMAYALGVQAAGLSAFDLIATEGPVSIPSRKNEFFVRQEPTRSAELSGSPTGVGYGPGFDHPTYPLAMNANIASLEPIAPELLVPMYIAEPSISKPKDPRLLEGPRG